MASQNLFEHPEVCCQSSPKVPKVNIPRMPQNFFLNLVNPNQIWILITIFRHKFGMEQQDSEKISVCVYVQTRKNNTVETSLPRQSSAPN